MTRASTRSRPRTRSQPEPARLHSRTGDPIDTWLALLTTMLRMPQHKAAEIRDELEDHLRTRVRDQLVAGVDEETAVRRAIDEVGEAAAVAHRFRTAARTPVRRLFMHASILSISVAALGVSIAAFTSGSPSQPAVYEYADSTQVEGLRAVEITTDPNWTFEQFARHVGDIAGKPVYIHWRSLADVGIDREDADWTFDVDIQQASFDTVMRLLNERLDWDNAVGLRTFEGRLEFASRDYLDELTVKLVRYDVADVIEAVSANWNMDAETARDEIIDLIQEYVEMEAWQANGGALASLRPVGNHLFIQAPERFFPKIEWLLEQLQAGHEPQAAEPDAVGVNVKDPRLIFVSGLVSRPGSYALPQESGISLRQLLAYAGDVSGEASKIRVWRGEVGARAIVHDIDLDARRLPERPDDYALLPGDLVEVR